MQSPFVGIFACLALFLRCLCLWLHSSWGCMLPFFADVEANRCSFLYHFWKKRLVLSLFRQMELSQSTLIKAWIMIFKPNRLLYHNVSRILVFVLFPNIFYFLVGIL